ncbi:hypothetical protein Hanom_Chr06g00506851 [Helianthus anomalus]
MGFWWVYMTRANGKHVCRELSFVYDGMSISAQLTRRGHYSRLDSSRRPFRVDAFDQCCYACKMRTSH